MASKPDEPMKVYLSPREYYAAVQASAAMGRLVQAITLMSHEFPGLIGGRVQGLREAKRAAEAFLLNGLATFEGFTKGLEERVEWVNEVARIRLSGHEYRVLLRTIGLARDLHEAASLALDVFPHLGKRVEGLEAATIDVHHWLEQYRQAVELVALAVKVVAAQKRNEVPGATTGIEQRGE